MQIAENHNLNDLWNRPKKHKHLVYQSMNWFIVESTC